MTDLECFTKMLSTAGIEMDRIERPRETVIRVERGYTFFFVEATFDENGKLINIGAWE